MGKAPRSKGEHGEPEKATAKAKTKAADSRKARFCATKTVQRSRPTLRRRAWGTRKGKGKAKTKAADLQSAKVCATQAKRRSSDDGEVFADALENFKGAFRSEERRVGKECRSRWSADQ